MPKTVTTTYYTYDELSDEAKKNVYTWWRTSSVNADLVQLNLDEDWSSFEHFIDSIGVKATNWSVAPYQRSWISTEVESGDLLDLYTLDDASYQEHVEWGSEIPSCPVGDSDGYWIAEGLAESWNGKVVPYINGLVSEIRELLAERGGEEEARLFEGLCAKLRESIDEALESACRHAADDMTAGAEGVDEEEYMVSFLEGNDYWFDENGNPER